MAGVRVDIAAVLAAAAHDIAAEQDHGGRGAAEVDGAAALGANVAALDVTLALKGGVGNDQLGVRVADLEGTLVGSGLDGVAVQVQVKAKVFGEGPGFGQLDVLCQVVVAGNGGQGVACGLAFAVLRGCQLVGPLDPGHGSAFALTAGSVIAAVLGGTADAVANAGLLEGQRKTKLVDGLGGIVCQNGGLPAFAAIVGEGGEALIAGGQGNAYLCGLVHSSEGQLQPQRLAGFFAQGQTGGIFLINGRIAGDGNGTGRIVLHIIAALHSAAGDGGSTGKLGNVGRSLVFSDAAGNRACAHGQGRAQQIHVAAQDALAAGDGAAGEIHNSALLGADIAAVIAGDTALDRAAGEIHNSTGDRIDVTAVVGGLTAADHTAGHVQLTAQIDGAAAIGGNAVFDHTAVDVDDGTCGGVDIAAVAGLAISAAVAGSAGDQGIAVNG